MKNKMDLLAGGILAVIFIAVFGAFFDVLTAKEAVQVLGVLAVVSVPLTLLGKLLA